MSNVKEQFYTETVMIRIIDGVLDQDQSCAVALKTCKGLIECEWSAFTAFANRANRLSELCRVTSFYGDQLHVFFERLGLIDPSKEDLWTSFKQLEDEVTPYFWIITQIKEIAVRYEHEDKLKFDPDLSLSFLESFIASSVASLLEEIRYRRQRKLSSKTLFDGERQDVRQAPEVPRVNSNEKEERLDSSSAVSSSSPSGEHQTSDQTLLLQNFELSQWLHSSEREPGFRKTLIFNGVEVGFVWIRPGDFDMGSPSGESGRKENETLHHVTITRGFWMLETLVTQRLFKAIMGDDDSKYKGDERPSDNLSYGEVVAFCEKIQKALPKELVVRLPTEAEWEYACRAGTRTAFNCGDLPCPLGFLIDVFAGREAKTERDKENIHHAHCLFCMMNHKEHFKKNDGHINCLLLYINAWPAEADTTPVKSYPANKWGLHDMHGNLDEWTADSFAPYPEGPVVDPHVQNDGARKVVRGGNHHNGLDDCRSASRGARDCSSGKCQDVGFRFILAPEKIG